MTRPDIEAIVHDASARSVLLMQSPLANDSLLLPTPPVELVVAQVKALVERSGTGAWASAPPGAGKSSAMQYVESVIPTLLPGVHTVYVSMDDKQMTSIRAFYIRFLAGLEHADLKGETPHLLNRIGNKIVDDTRFNRCGTVLILMDEAQLLTTKDLQFLRTLYNDIRRAGLGVICFLMGEAPGLDKLIVNLRCTAFAGLYGRFGKKRLAFRGYRDAKDIACALHEIDKADFADDLPVPIPRMYAPSRWDKGWRLSHEADDLWNSIRELEPAKSDMEVPARPLYEAIRVFLRCVDEVKGTGGSRGLWQSALDEVAMGDSLALMGFARAAERASGRINL